MLFFAPIIILSAVTPSFSDFFKAQPTSDDWDYIVYSQRWPITSCIVWEEKGSKNTCSLPQDNANWTVHGVWPTKIGTNGPYFCNSALHFDPDQLTPFMKELQAYWPNIEANTKPNSFWKHEWNKHGTCASRLPQLNSVTNFFKQGLQWNHDYSLAGMLAKSNIVPNSQGYNVSDVFDAVKAGTGKNPSIQCVIDSKSKDSLVSEIRICFNKSFDVIDCNVNKTLPSDGVLGNCNMSKSIMYMATVPNITDTGSLENMFFDEYEEPNIERCLDSINFQGKLLKFYGVIKFLMWFTL